MSDAEKIGAMEVQLANYEAERAEAARMIMALTLEVLRLLAEKGRRDVSLAATVPAGVHPVTAGRYWFARSADGTVVGPFSWS